ncbi:MAG: hypothetical protein ACQEWM_04730 [Actinomycetota bacterium]
MPMPASSVRALVQERYGSAASVRLDELPVPEPGAGAVLVRVRAASLNGSDRENLLGRPAYARLGGLRRPGIRCPARTWRASWWRWRAA